ncbi:ileal sodium/bile acid cotransporter-like isoform X2 [Prorops nasuta]|uniref:ileal sodium/bile acid cotransporter-like isoform X2 n=1 Tax=Prorops nasuta TaxID=863751 RepID=UPI0034CD1E54
MALFLLGLFLLQTASVFSWSAEFGRNVTTVHIYETMSIPVRISKDFNDKLNCFMTATSSDESILMVDLELFQSDYASHNCHGMLNITGVFLGKAKIMFNQSVTDIKHVLSVATIRQERVIDHIFTGSVIILVSLLYINFGCAMDWSVCQETLRRPIGPLIGMFCQFIIMPLLSYGIGLVLFPTHPEMQLGMFFTGISPSGGASNIWTLLLGGNLNLSVTMTTICTLVAFGMMPFWVFTLGRYIFDRGELAVPYSRIASFAAGLIIPLAIGYLIQRKLPKLCRIMIIVAGMGLPWLGFMFGGLLAFIFKQTIPDIKAIAIETGIQNTGVAIFLLRVGLKAPEDDLTTVLPVSTAIMTPLPLIVFYVIKLVRDRKQKIPSSDASLDKFKNEN